MGIIVVLKMDDKNKTKLECYLHFYMCLWSVFFGLLRLIIKTETYENVGCYDDYWFAFVVITAFNHKTHTHTRGIFRFIHGRTSPFNGWTRFDNSITIFDIITSSIHNSNISSIAIWTIKLCSIQRYVYLCVNEQKISTRTRCEMRRPT